MGDVMELISKYLGVLHPKSQEIHQKTTNLENTLLVAQNYFGWLRAGHFLREYCVRG
jgi:hypothetical protein